jgi:hypothetical protein
MSRWKLYVRLTWLFFISLFVPTATMKDKVEKLLTELQGGAPPGPAA